MTNLERADAAEKCIDLLIQLTGPELSAQEAAGDLIANIGHYCDAASIDFLDVVRTAVGHWHIEQTDEESIDALPDVTINIHQ